MDRRKNVITLMSSKDSTVKSLITSRVLADRLTTAYPHISTSSDVFWGTPVLRGTRFTVADVLSYICTSHSFEDVRQEFKGRYSEEQFQDALRYARDFMLESLDK